MHKLERYGVVALVFLLMTILAVSLWQSGETAEPAGPQGTALAQRPAANLPRTPPPASTASRARPEATPAATPAAQREAPPIDAPGADPRRATAQQPDPARRAALARADLERERPATERRADPEETARPSQPPSRGGDDRADRAAPGARPAAAAGTYTVRAGDTLSEIAQRTLGAASRWKEIAALNANVDPARLRVGDELRLPSGAAAGAAPGAAPAQATAAMGWSPAAPSARAPGGDYVVQKGDTLSEIAQRQLGSADRWKDLVAANPGLDPRKLKVGQRLTLPAGSAAPARGTGVTVASASVPMSWAPGDVRRSGSSKVR